MLRSCCCRYTAKLKQRHDVVAAQQSFPGGQATLAAKARVAEAKEEQLAVVKLQAVQRGNVVRKETEAEKERQRLLADAEARRQRVTAEMAAREAAREAALREAARAVEEVSDLDDADADSLWMEGDPAAAAAEAAAAKAATKAAAMEADAAKAAAAAFYKAAEKADAAKALAARADALKAEEEAAALKVQSLVRGHQARNAQEESRRIASLRFYVADGAYDEARKLAMTPAEEATIQQAEEEEKAAAKRAAWAKEAEEEWKRKKAAKEAKEAAEKEAAEKEAAKKNAAEKADVAKALAARAAALKAEEAAALKVQSLAAAARAAAAKVLEMQAEEESAAAKRAAWAKEAEEEWKRKKAVKEAAEREAAEKEAEKAAAEAAAAEAAAAEAAAAKAAAEKRAAEKAAAEEIICKRQKTKIERQPEGKLLKSASSGAPRSIEEKLDYTKADASKWIFNEVVYKGAAVAVSVGQEERVQGLIRDGLRKLREEPSKYFAIKYQSNMVDWPEEHQEYRLIHREGTLGYQPQRHPDGSFTILMADYQPLPSVPKMVARDMDASTDVMTFQGYTLHHARNPPLCPGRGMGVCDMPSLKIIGDVDPSDVNQGSVGDCWLLSAISALAEFDGAVSTLFRKTPNLQSMPHEQPNKYTITLWDLATWKEVDVVVDERLASKATGDGLLGCAPSIDGELWVCYLEKAVAIHCGGWDEIDGGQCTHAWSLLTGCKEQYTIRRGPSGKFGCKGKFNPNDEVWEQLENSPQKGFRGLWPSAWPKVGGGGDYTLELDEEELFIRMCAWDDANYILAAGSKAGSDTEMTDGVVDGHAYSIIDCINDVAGTDVDLIKMRNPWGKGEIEQGQFDDDGPGWDRYPEIKAELNPVAADDGIFYVTKEEFFKYFVTVYVCAKDMSEFLNPNDEKPAKRQKTKIERQPEGKLLKSASSGAPRSIEEKLDYTKADASKWIFNEVVYKGAAVAVSVGQEERVQGLIRDGLRKLREEPSKYFAIKYQSNMVDWPEEHQEYRLIHREGTLGYQPQRHPDGSFTILMADYQPLPSVPKMVARDMDASTDVMTFQGYTLHHARNPPLCPGRGMGVCDMPSLKIIGDVDPSDVNQGSVGDCWLLSAISALAEFDGAVSTLFRKTPNLQSMPHEQPNKYTITLWDLATWKEVDVVVDERLASKATGDGLLGCAPSIDGELWVCYLEKAVAIHCGGWDEIDGGQCTHAWSLLTGCKEQYTIRRGPSGKFGCKGKFNPNDEVWEQLENSPQKGFRGLWPSAWPKVGGGGDYTLELDEEELFIRMCAWDDANYILAAGSKAGSDTEMTDGVVDGHAYSIIDCINDVAGTDVDLIKMRNPWGKGEIEQGQFDDDGPGWDRYPEIKAELNPVAADDGIFYVTKEEFFKYFVTVYVCAKDMSEFLNPNDEILIKAAAENAAAEKAAAEKAAAEKAAAEKAAAEKAAESAIEAEAEVELRSGSRGQALPAKPVHEQPGVVPITPSHPEKQRDAALQAERHYGAGLEASKRGETARALGYFEQALNALEQAHEPERPTYLLSAGNMHLKMGEPAKALILYEKCQLACQLRPMTSTQTAILEEKMRLARDAMAAAKWAKEKRGALGSLAQGAGAGLGTLAESTLNSLTPLWRQVLGVADLFKEPKPQRYNMLRDSPADAKYKVCIVQFKVPGAKNGGLDKGFDGNRIDSIPIANGVIQAGGACDIVRFDSDKNKSDIREFELLTAKYDALIVRINQGQLSQGTPRGTQKRFDALMSKYVAKGKLVLGHENQPLPPLRSEFTVGEFICSSRLAQLTTKQFQAVCGGDKTLADVPDDDYYEACVLTDTMGVKVIEMLEARLPCLNTQTSMASNGPDAEVSLLSTQERGVREVKIGSACASAAVPSAQPNSQRTLSEAASLAYLSRHPPPASTNTCCTPLHRRGPRRHARTGRCERDGQPRPQHSALREPGV